MTRVISAARTLRVRGSIVCGVFACTLALAPRASAQDGTIEQLVATARRLNRYEFALTFAPLPVEGGTGSPVNPLVIF